jgi:cytochrome d ubiquinol oxidase subunit II
VELHTVWFVLIAVLWIGYFVLEGFDFGVGMLLPLVSRDDLDRQVVLRSIGPVWDGNEVWLLVAGGATFAAFPEWYASLFAGFYLPLLLILVALIVRGVAIEYRNKSEDALWRSRWDAAIVVSSFVPALLWGVAFANIVRGVAMNADHEVTAGFWSLLNPYALLGGVVTLVLFALHGAVFLALKTGGDVRVRSAALATRLGAVAVVGGAVFLVWTQAAHGRPATHVTATLAALCLIGAVAANVRGREGWAFLGTAVTLALVVATLFGDLWPDVLPSTTSDAFSLTVTNASSTPYTLKVMTWVAGFATPVVLAYQAWTYWVFRQRLVRPEAVVVPAPRTPGEATAAPAR